MNAGIWSNTALEPGKGVLYRPRVVNIYGRYYMFINGGPDGDAALGGPNENIYVAVSDNPTKDWKVLDVCILAEKLFPTENHKICADPDILVTDKYVYMFFWSSYGICVSRSRKDKFPITWEYLGVVSSWEQRPLIIPTDNTLYLVTNSDGAKTIKLYFTVLGNI